MGAGAMGGGGPQPQCSYVGFQPHSQPMYMHASTNTYADHPNPYADGGVAGSYGVQMAVSPPAQRQGISLRPAGST